MNRSIILVGPNASGKSTLGQNLARRLNLPYHHAGTSPGDIDSCIECTISQYEMISKGVILDRFTPICERVYCENISALKWALLYNLVGPATRRAQIIYCTAEGEPVKKDYYSDSHFNRVVNDQKQIRARYDEIMDSVTHVKFNWRKHSIDQLIYI